MWWSDIIDIGPRFQVKENVDLSWPICLCRAAPKLKDVDLSDSKARELYLQVVTMMRTMYQQCRLVHADLSEFNMLWVIKQIKQQINQILRIGQKRELSRLFVFRLLPRKAFLIWLLGNLSEKLWFTFENQENCMVYELDETTQKIQNV